MDSQALPAVVEKSFNFLHSQVAGMLTQLTCALMPNHAFVFRDGGGTKIFLHALPLALSVGWWGG